MVLSRNKMIRKIFSLFVMYLLIVSSINLDVKAQQTEIDWNDEKQVKEALKKDPTSTINSNTEKAKEFIRKNHDFILENPDVGNAYFNSIGKITEPRDKELAEKFLSKNIQKNFDLSKGKLQIKDGNIVDEQGKNFILEEIKLMADVVTVESIEGGGLRFYFKKKHIVDIIEAKNIKQDKDNLIVDGKQISLAEEKQLLKINSDDKGLAVSCQAEKCNFARNGINVNLASQGSYEETSNLIKTEKAVVTSGQNKIFGSAEFYYDSSGIDKTKPISLIGETSSALIDGQKHRSTPKSLPIGPELKNILEDSVDKNQEFIDKIIDPKHASITKMCLQCYVNLKEEFDRDIESGKISGYVFGLTNPISNKRIMLNKGEVISNYDNALIIGTHKSSEFRTNINENNIIIDGPHSNEKNAYLGSVITNNGRIDHSNEDGRTVSKKDRTYSFGNVPTTRFFFPEAIDENVRNLITISDFITASNVNPSSGSGTLAVNSLFDEKTSIDSLQDPVVREAYRNLANLLDEDKKSKQVANVNDAFIKDQRVTNLYLFKKDGELKLSQSGENHELFKVIAKEQVNDAFLSFLATKPEVLDDPQARSQLQRLMEFMVWKNTAVHQAAARYEELTNVWGYTPLGKYNPALRAYNFVFGEDKNLFNKIVENDNSQEGAQAILSLMKEGFSLKEIREMIPPATDIPISDSKIGLVFRDPGVNARLEIERLSENVRDVQDFEKFKVEKIRILRETIDTYKSQNEPEQALIFLPELIRERYGEEGEDILQKLINKNGELCDASTTCGGLLHQKKDKFGKYGISISYPKEWPAELVSDIKELYDTNLEIQQDENRRKFREFAESFFDAEQLTYGALLSTISGGTGAIIGKTAQLVKSVASPLGKAYYTLRGGALLGEEVVTGISSSFIKVPTEASVGIAVVSPTDLRKFRDVKIKDLNIWEAREPFRIELSTGKIYEHQPTSFAQDIRMQVISMKTGGEVVSEVPFITEEIEGGFRTVERVYSIPNKKDIISLRSDIPNTVIDDKITDLELAKIYSDRLYKGLFGGDVDLERSFGVTNFESVSSEDKLKILNEIINTEFEIYFHKPNLLEGEGINVWFKEGTDSHKIFDFGKAAEMLKSKREDILQIIDLERTFGTKTPFEQLDDVQQTELLFEAGKRDFLSHRTLSVGSAGSGITTHTHPIYFDTGSLTLNRQLNEIARRHPFDTRLTDEERDNLVKIRKVVKDEEGKNVEYHESRIQELKSNLDEFETNPNLVYLNEMKKEVEKAFDSRSSERIISLREKLEKDGFVYNFDPVTGQELMNYDTNTGEAMILNQRRKLHLFLDHIANTDIKSINMPQESINDFKLKLKREIDSYEYFKQRSLKAIDLLGSEKSLEDLYYRSLDKGVILPSIGKFKSGVLTESGDMYSLLSSDKVTRLPDGTTLRRGKIIYPHGVTYTIVEGNNIEAKGGEVIVGEGNIVHLVSIQGNNVQTYKAPLDKFLEDRTMIFRQLNE